MAAMPGPIRLRRTLLPLAAVLGLAALVGACGTTQVAPTGSASSSTATTSGNPDASPAEPPSSAGSDLSPGTSGGTGVGTAAPNEEPASQPPAGDPQQDEACFAILPAADVGAALGAAIGDVVAVGTDPSLNLACTYTAANGGTLLVSAAAGDAATAFQSNQDLASGYGQNPVAIDGLGDQAFYAMAADRWPEQVVFAKGPVLVRLVNQTSATIGQATFAALAATAAEAVRAEIPPAP